MYGNLYFSSKPRFRGGLSNPNIGGYYSQYHSDYQNLYNRLTNPQSGLSITTRRYIDAGAQGQEPPEEANAYFKRAASPFTPRVIDPEAAIQASIAPIESRRNEQFSAVAARLGRLGGMGGSPMAMGLGRVAQQAAQDIASGTQDRLMQAAMDNARRELEAEQMRRQNEMAAGRSLMDYASQYYDRMLRAGSTLGELELSREGNLATLAAQLAGLHSRGAEGDLERGWQSWEKAMERNFQSDEAKRAWLYGQNIDPDDPWAWRFPNPYARFGNSRSLLQSGGLPPRWWWP